MDPQKPGDHVTQPSSTLTKSLSRLLPLSSHKLTSVTRRFLQTSAEAHRYLTGQRPVSDSSGRHHTSTQKLTPSLLNLPMELRQQIWRETLGSKIMHIRSLVDGVIVEAVFSRCLSPHPQACGSFGGVGGCAKYHRLHNSQDKSVRKWRISLLLACKQIHAEAIELLYTNAIFKTTSAEIIHSLPALFPTNLHSIRSLFFIYHLSEPPVQHLQYGIYSGLQTDIDSWVHTWRVLASLEGLVQLTVKLRTLDAWYMTPWDEMNEQQVGRLLEPIRKVKGGRLEKWDLLITFECDLEQEVWRTLPCRVRRIRRGADLTFGELA